MVRKGRLLIYFKTCKYVKRWVSSIFPFFKIVLFNAKNLVFSYSVKFAQFSRDFYEFNGYFDIFTYFDIMWFTYFDIIWFTYFDIVLFTYFDGMWFTQKKQTNLNEFEIYKKIILKSFFKCIKENLRTVARWI